MVNKMLSVLKNNSALTIIEVLVSIILTAIVMLHGTGFFIATWRLSAESKEYNMILNDVVANLEKTLSLLPNMNIDSSTDPSIGNGNYVVKSKKLRDKFDVKYTLSVQNHHRSQGFRYIVSKAEWRYGGNKNSNNVISIKTAVANTKWN